MKRKIAIACGSVPVVVLAWFLAVDLSWFIESCPDCGFRKDLIQHRVFGRCVHEAANEYPTVLQRVAADLGAECQHPAATRRHKHRYWGLLFCAAPCHNGTDGLVGDDSWYNETASAKVRALVSSRPALRDEFRQRVLLHHEAEFSRTILEDAGVIAATEEADVITED